MPHHVTCRCRFQSKQRLPADHTMVLCQQRRSKILSRDEIEKRVNAKEIPLASGLIGREESIHGQLEVGLINYNTIRIGLRRNIYCGLPDVVFSISDSDMQDLLNVLIEAKEKLDSYWLSRVTATKAGAVVHE